MTRAELAVKAAQRLLDDGYCKRVSLPKQTLTVSDKEGNSKDFDIKLSEKTVRLSAEDISAAIGAVIEEIQVALANGEVINLRGLGTIDLFYVKPKTIYHVTTGEEQFIPGHYRPKFIFSSGLKSAATLYSAAIKDAAPYAMLTGIDIPDNSEGEDE